MYQFSVKIGSEAVRKLVIVHNQARHTSIAFTNFTVGEPFQVRPTEGIFYLGSTPTLAKIDP